MRRAEAAKATTWRRRNLDLIDFTGRQVYPGKRGKIKESEPSALDQLGLNPEHWSHRVKGFGFALALWRQPTRACWLGNVELRRAAVALDAGRLIEANAALQRAGAMIERVATEVPMLAAEHAVLGALLLQRTDPSAAIAAKSHAEVLLAKLRTIPPALRDRVSAMRAVANMASPQKS